MATQNNSTIAVPRLLLVLLLSLVIAPQFVTVPGCGGDDSPATTGPGPIVENPPDTIPPETVTTLHIEAPTFETVALVWIAPGDDGDSGTAERYDIRYAKFDIDETTWDQATRVDPSRIPPPSESGRVETIVIMELDSGADYWFALKTIDEADNISEVSNAPTERTKDEAFPPSDITDLTAEAVGSLGYHIRFTSPGDDYNAGTATAYEIRYSVYPILSDAGWNNASIFNQSHQPKRGGERDTIQVTVLIEAGIYFFAMKAVDELDNWSGRSNLAQALGVNFDLAFSPGYVHPGGVTYIMFRAATDTSTRVAIQEYTYGDLYCGDNIVDYIVSETLEGGIHSVTYDFVDDETGRYFPFDFYQLSLCHGPYMINYKWISFNE